MHVYFVRHGETIDDHKRIHRSLLTPLSEHGQQQAQFVAERFKHINIDKILASDLKRAFQTAEIINTHLQVSLETSALLRERKRPSELIGLAYESETAIEIKRAIWDHVHDPNWRYSDEENFSDLKQRISELKTCIERQQVAQLLIVTHEVIIKLFILMLMVGDELSSYDFIKFRNFFTLDNTGLSLCQYDHHQWRLLTLNDTAHLGYI